MGKVFENFTVDEVFAKVFRGPPYPHQSETVRALLEGKSVVLRAPCGSGKTDACYASFVLGRDFLADRMIYSLPTRALADEIAERIKNGTDKIGLHLDVSAQHGANSKDPFFKSDIIVATIDQTVGAYCCTPLSLPAYLGNIPAGAAVSGFHCFDEAHTYDRVLGLQSMLVLIERSHFLGLPVLVMSATLPDSFLNWFQDKFGDAIKIVEGRDDYVKSRRERQVVLYWKNKCLDTAQVFQATKNCDKVMVVCNTVDRAQTLHRLLSEPLKEKKFKVFLLHSRFLDQHRKIIEQEMRRNLEKPGEKTCLLTTQVCEVGLDISCDMLLTELAPADSLIQRMGRCARKGGKGEVWVFDVEHTAPYPEIEMIESKTYISQKLNSKRIGWNEELEFVNSLLGRSFELIMNDEQRRRKILRSLGDASFKGSKKDVEKNIREMFNANITIHDNPHSLGFHTLLHLPWIDIDVRVLKRHLIGKAKFWKVDFGHDEYGSPDLRFLSMDDIFPYEYYVVHPDSVKYTADCGLFFGEKGENFKPIEICSEPKQSLEYEKEPWIDHAKNAVTAFEQRIKPKETHALRLLSKLLGKNLTQTEGIVVLSIALHDLGKLNVDWQRKFHVTGEPLAHAASLTKVQLPPHATVSAYSMSQLFSSLVGSEIYALAFELAVGHHHHTRAENVPNYRLGWKELYDGLIREISEEFQLAVRQNIQEEIKTPAVLDTSFFDFEKKKQYTAYCIIARLIRLSDRASFELKNDALKLL